jgi:hypothetical protein
MPPSVDADMRFKHPAIANSFLFFGILAWLTHGGAHFARAQDSEGITEVIPTSKGEPVKWRYTLRRPASPDWKSAGFDDKGWSQGAGPFANEGTPGIHVGTRWTSADI